MCRTSKLAVALLALLACTASAQVPVPFAFWATPAVTDTMPTAMLKSLIAYWPLDETGGVRYSVYPASVGLALTDNNTVWYTSGKFGNAATFKADSLEYLSRADAGAGDSLRLGTPSGFTMSFWAYRNSSSLIQVFPEKGGSTGATAEYHMLPYSDGAVYYCVGASEYTASAAAGGFTQGTWHHVVMRYVDNGTSDTVQIFRNDTLVHATITSVSIGASPSLAFQIGKFHTASIYGGANIDDCAMWQRALNRDEMRYIYNSGTGRKVKP